MKKKVLIVCADYYWRTTLSLKVDAENILDKANILQLNLPLKPLI